MTCQLFVSSLTVLQLFTKGSLLKSRKRKNCLTIQSIRILKLSCLRYRFQTQFWNVKVLKVYDPDQHDYETDKPSMVEIRPGHYVWANQAELERYKNDLK